MTDIRMTSWGVFGGPSKIRSTRAVCVATLTRPDATPRLQSSQCVKRALGLESHNEIGQGIIKRRSFSTSQNAMSFILIFLAPLLIVTHCKCNSKSTMMSSKFLTRGVDIACPNLKFGRTCPSWLSFWNRRQGLYSLRKYKKIRFDLFH